MEELTPLLLPQVGHVEVEVEELLQNGEWFLSLNNDDGAAHEVALTARQGATPGECPQRCSGNGHCFLGRCQCRQGYIGDDCSQGGC